MTSVPEGVMIYLPESEGSMNSSSGLDGSMTYMPVFEGSMTYLIWIGKVNELSSSPEGSITCLSRFKGLLLP